MNHAEEATKIAKNTRFAVIGRAIADAQLRGAPCMPMVQEAAILRAAEQSGASREVRFAGLTRQLGDAHRAGTDTGPLLKQLAELRRAELGSSLPS